MRRWGWVLVVCGAVAIAAGYPPAGRAELLRFAFRGRVASVFSDGPLNPPPITPGDPFQGSFSYDPNASPAPVGLSPPTFLSPGQVTLRLRGWTWHSDPTQPISLTLLGSLPSLPGAFTVTGQMPDPGLFTPPALLGILNIDFSNALAGTFPTTPPTQLDQYTAALELTFPSRLSPAVPSFSLTGTIDELTPEDLVGTPEPGTLVLGLLGALGCGCPPAVRRFRQAASAWATRLSAATAVALASSTALAGPVTFDAAAQFSAERNPSGPWSYGWSDALTSPFHAFTVHYNLTGLGLDFWNAPIGPDGLTDLANAAGVLHNGTEHEISMLNSIWSPGRLGLQPGFNGQYSIVRWTAPTDGRVAVRATFRGLDLGTTTADVHVLRNGTALFNGVIQGYDIPDAPPVPAPGVFPGAQRPGPRIDSQSVSLPSLTVSRGDTIDFAVGFGDDHEAITDSTGLEASITEAALADAPEPGTSMLAVTGLLALGSAALFGHRRWLWPGGGRGHLTIHEVE